MKSFLTAALAISLFHSQVALAQKKPSSSAKIAQLEARADGGDVDAQFALARLYASGDGAPMDKKKSVGLYLRAAAEGHVEAQYMLGLSFLLGEGVEPHNQIAYKWLSIAAANGHQKAREDAESMAGDLSNAERENVERNVQQFLRNKSKLPNNPPQDKTESSRDAIANVRARAEKGDYEAQFVLGSLYAKGEGVEVNFAEARKWYRKAADQGDAPAEAALGSLYLTGKGVPKNPEEAVKWFRRAADQGYVDGQWALGTVYFMGEGVPRDQVEAYKWYLLASEQGNKLAKQGLSLLERSLTDAEQAEGRRRAKEFKPRTRSNESKPNASTDFPQPALKAAGTGFFITSNGYLITNEHVTAPGSKVRIATREGTIPAEVIKVDKTSDLALLKAEGQFFALPVISSRSVGLGTNAATVGFPNIHLQGSLPKLAKGEISGLAGSFDDARHFQISVPIQPGNSGGALVDERGNVIGIVAAKLKEDAALASSGVSAERVNYAVKSSFLLSFLESSPEVIEQLKKPNTGNRKFEEVIKDVEQGTVLVLVN